MKIPRNPIHCCFSHRAGGEAETFRVFLIWLVEFRKTSAGWSTCALRKVKKKKALIHIPVHHRPGMSTFGRRGLFQFANRARNSTVTLFLMNKPRGVEILTVKNSRVVEIESNILFSCVEMDFDSRINVWKERFRYRTSWPFAESTPDETFQTKNTLVVCMHIHWILFSRILIKMFAGLVHLFGVELSSRHEMPIFHLKTIHQSRRKQFN